MIVACFLMVTSAGCAPSVTSSKPEVSIPDAEPWLTEVRVPIKDDAKEQALLERSGRVRANRKIRCAVEARRRQKAIFEKRPAPDMSASCLRLERAATKK